MTTSAHIALISRQELEKLSREHIDLKTGDKLEGDVLEVRKDGKAVVDFGRFQTALELKVPVEKGDVISVVVETAEKGKQIKLKLQQVQSKTKIPRDLQNALKQAESIRTPSADEIQRQTQSDRVVPEDVELPTDKNKSDFFKGGALPRDLKDSLVKLKQILQSPENINIKNLSGEIKGILETLQSYSDSLDIGEKIAKPVAQLNNYIRSGDSGMPVDKEVREILEQITEAAGRIAKMKNIEQLPQIKSIIQQDLKPNLQQLREIQHAPEDVKKAVDELLKNMEKTIEKLPDKIVHRGDVSRPREIDALVKQIADLKILVENSRIPLEKETSEALNKLSDAAAKISRTKAPEQSPQIKTIIENDVKPNLLRLKETMDREIPKTEPAQQRAAGEIKQAVENSLETLEKTLERLPDKIKNSEQIETLLNEIKNIRRTLESRGEIPDLGNRIVRQVSGIKMLAQSYELPFEKEVEAFIARLSQAADKIGQIKTPEQLPQLKSIIENELRPNLSALKEIIDRGASLPEQLPRQETVKPQNPETSETREAVEAIRRRVEDLRRDIDTTIEELPDKTRSSQDVRDLLKDIESALNKISDFSYIGSQNVPTEDIETLFENIKIALGQLKSNIQTGQGQLELPPEIKDIFTNLQLDFNAADLDKAVSQQIAQLNTLIEILQDSGFAADKRVEAILAKLTEIVHQLGELKESGAPNKWQKILQLLDRELKPNIKNIKDIFNPRDSIQNDVIRDKMATVSDAVDTLDRQVIQLFEKHAGQTKPAESLGKADNIPGEVKDIFTKLPRSLQTPENMTRLSQVIQGLESTLPEDIRPMLSTLRSHFEPLDIGQGAVKLVPKLKSMVEDSGVFFEKKIQDVVSRLSEASARIGAIDNLNQLPEIRNIINNDLKPNLLRLQEYLAGDKLESQLGQQETLEVIKKSVEDLLNNINTQQSRAVETQTQQQPVMVFSFNLPIKGEQDAQLKVFYNRGKKREEEGEFKLSLLLNMERLGEIRTDFSHYEDNLNVTFFVGTYKIKEYIEENLDELEEPLGEEFKSLNFNVMVSEEQIAAFDMEPAAPGIISDKAVDVNV